MAIAECPGCGTTLQLQNDRPGQVRCPKCQLAFKPAVIPVAPLAKDAVARRPQTSAVVPPRKGPAPRVETVVEVVDDDEVIDIPNEEADRRAQKGMVLRTKVALLLMFIGLCATMLSLILATLFLVLCWAKTGPTEHRVEIIGMPGLLGWLISLVGTGFAIAGLQRRGALAYSIALASVATIHLLLLSFLALGEDQVGFASPRPLFMSMPESRTASSMPGRPMNPPTMMPTPFRGFTGPTKPLQYFDTALLVATVRRSSVAGIRRRRHWHDAGRGCPDNGRDHVRLESDRRPHADAHD
ncbi:MAG: hypothetical protein ACJ8C4_12550 [Gemmataceae bacterium]